MRLRTILAYIIVLFGVGMSVAEHVSGQPNHSHTVMLWAYFVCAVAISAQATGFRRRAAGKSETLWKAISSLGILASAAIAVSSLFMQDDMTREGLGTTFWVFMLIVGLGLFKPMFSHPKKPFSEVVEPAPPPTPAKRSGAAPN